MSRDMLITDMFMIDFEQNKNLTLFKERLNEKYKDRPLPEKLQIVKDSLSMEDLIYNLVSKKHYDWVIRILSAFPEYENVDTYSQFTRIPFDKRHWEGIIKRFRQKYPILCLFEMIQTREKDVIKFLLKNTDLAYQLRAPFKKTEETQLILNLTSFTDYPSTKQMIDFVEACVGEREINLFYRCVEEVYIKSNR